ncbi:MAG: hypothetical protein ABEJ55_01060 [Halanaeroarchaeum sp.]
MAALTVTDYVLYALAGTHPHVHRRANTQYVIVRVEPSLSSATIRDRFTLELDGEPVPLADRQPFSWRSETIDVAFAVPKGQTYDGGRVRWDETTRFDLGRRTLRRLNNPPVFEVSDPAVSPRHVRAGEQIDATVEWTLGNAGEGAGEFGASLGSNYLSGAVTVRATLEAGAERAVTATIPIIGDGEVATVRLDWGSGEWTADIPVVDDTA